MVKSDNEAKEEIEDVDDEVESNYGSDVDIDMDADVDVEDSKQEEDDDEEEEEEEPSLVKKRTHVYHQVPDSTVIKIIKAENRITSEYMTIYEYAMVIGTRATHISGGSTLFTDPEGLSDPRDIAKKEIDECMCPLSITRRLSPDAIEIWEVNEMVKPQM